MSNLDFLYNNDLSLFYINDSYYSTIKFWHKIVYYRTSICMVIRISSCSQTYPFTPLCSTPLIWTTHWHKKISFNVVGGCYHLNVLILLFAPLRTQKFNPSARLYCMRELQFHPDCFIFRTKYNLNWNCRCQSRSLFTST